MFLDDKLYGTTVDFLKSGSADVQKLNADLFQICVKHLQSKIAGRKPEEAKARIDRVFKSFDVFVNRLETSKVLGQVVIAQVFKKFPIKKQLLQNKEFSKEYFKLCVN